jgi:hypothetical protein
MISGNQWSSRSLIPNCVGIEGPTGPAGPSGPTGPAGDEGGVGPPGDKGRLGNNGTSGALGLEGPQGPLAPFKIKYVDVSAAIKYPPGDPEYNLDAIPFDYTDKHTLFVIIASDAIMLPAWVTRVEIVIRFYIRDVLNPITDTNFWIQFKPWNTTTNPRLNVVFKVTTKTDSDYTAYKTYPASVPWYSGEQPVFTGISYIKYTGPVEEFRIC